MNRGTTKRVFSFLFACFAAVPVAAAEGGVLATGEVVAVRFDLALKAPTQRAITGRLLLRRAAPSEALAETIVLEIAPLHGTLTTNLPRESRWEVSAEIPGFWLQPRQFIARPEDAHQALALWPLGRLHGTVLRASGEPLPKSLLVTSLPSRPSQGAKDRPRGQLACPIDEQGRFVCELPATEYDLSVGVPGFVPRYHWSVVIPTEGSLDLGRFPLTRGASVVGWIDDPAGKLDPRTATVRLLPASIPGGDLSAAEKRRSAALETHPLPTGFFQLRGANPGFYVVELEQPGFSRRTSSPIHIANPEEITLPHPIELRRLTTVLLNLDPPLDWRQRPWQIRLARRNGLRGGLAAETAFEGAASQNGQVEVGSLLAGSYDVSVIDSAGEALWVEREVPFEGSDDEVHTLAIRWLTVSGTLTLGGEPLAATLFFGGERGALRRRVRSDDEGRFTGILPRVTDTVVEIVAEAPPLRLVRKVRIEPKPGDRARLEIELEDHRVVGHVVDETGNAVSGAEVALSSAEEFPLTAETNDHGDFSFQGVARGVYELSAVLTSGDDTSFSTPLGVTVDALAGRARELGPFELRLKKGRRVAGQVLSNRGPATGAAIDAFALLPFLGFVGGASGNDQGRFGLVLPAGVERLLLVVSLPGAALTPFEVAPSDLVRPLVVTDDGGTLVLQGDTLGGGRWTLARDGIEIPRQLLVRWAQLQGAAKRDGSGFEIPALAVGDYRLCVPLESDSEPTCTRGFLNAGELLTLEAPATRSATPRSDLVSRP